MSTDKVTSQGVRDLGGNSSTVRKRCLHIAGPEEQIGRTLAHDYPGGCLEYQSVYGRKCVWCRKVMR